jgi:prepilin peptidase dependent protein A/type IV fimbrial biogenesis protein FimT
MSAQNTSGLTLLELLLVLSITSVLLLLGAPTYQTLQAELQLRAAIQVSYFALQQARSNAISQGQNITVAFQDGGDWCLGLSDAGVCQCSQFKNCTLAGVEHTVRRLDYPLVSLENLKFGKEKIAVFDGIRGVAAGHGGSAVFAAGNTKLRLILSHFGRIRICALTTDRAGYHKC